MGFIFYNSYLIYRQMATSMNTLRDRRANQQETNLGNTLGSQENSGFKLSMPQEEPQQPYMPSSSTGIAFQSRTATRMFKGKFERGQSQEQKFQSTAGSQKTQVPQPRGYGVNSPEEPKGFKAEQSNGFGTSITGGFTKPPLQQPTSGLKLFLPDEEDYTQEKEKKLTSLLKLTEPKPAPIKKILIQRREEPEPPVEEKLEKKAEERKVEEKKVEPPKAKETYKAVEPIEEIPISQLKPQNLPTEDIENQNELVECPEGCGRKFNKKALESHAKACKLVFMSKRKEFNSQAKRVTSKEQANIVKQAKMKEKREVSKGDKMGEAWKTQSEGFRAVIKAIKAEDLPEGEDKEIGVVVCEHCEKKFSEILISKHLPICEVKREKDRKAKKPAKK